MEWPYKGDVLVILGDICTIVDISVSKSPISRRLGRLTHLTGVTNAGVKREILMLSSEYSAYRDAVCASLVDAWRTGSNDLRVVPCCRRCLELSMCCCRRVKRK